VSCTAAADVAVAIRSMIVRGAPAIGCAAAFGVALEAQRQKHGTPAQFAAAMELGFKTLAESRPTAVNLFWALDRMRAVLSANKDDPMSAAAKLAEAALRSSSPMWRQSRHRTRRRRARADGARVLTHCNTGALATAGHGTALGVIRSARDQGSAFR